MVCSLPNIVHEAHSITLKSAQATELVTLVRACCLFYNQVVTIYTDRRFAFGVAHDFAKIWHTHGFKTADGKPISHATLVSDLLESSLLPKQIAVVKVRGHGDSDSVRCNCMAVTIQEVAKWAAKEGSPSPHVHDATVFSFFSYAYTSCDIDIMFLQTCGTQTNTRTR